MSGIGEALAIVSCVAGLIQAYDAAGRTIDRIKERRKARQAPPPSIRLEQSVEQGKRQIAEAVEDGKKRFGPDFEKGDGRLLGLSMGSTLTVDSRCTYGTYGDNDSNTKRIP